MPAPITAGSDAPKTVENILAASLRTASVNSPKFLKLAATLGIDADLLAKACDDVQVLLIEPVLMEPLESLLSHPDLAGGEVWPAYRDRSISGADMIDFACRVHGELVDRMKDSGLDMGVYVQRIQHLDEHGDGPCFWLHGEGWIDSPIEASLTYGFLRETERPATSMQSGESWERFAAAIKEHDRNERSDTPLSPRA